MTTMECRRWCPSLAVLTILAPAAMTNSAHASKPEAATMRIEGRVDVFFDGETREVGPGGGFHAPSWVPHGVTAITDCVMLSCKNVIDGVGHEL